MVGCAPGQVNGAAWLNPRPLRLPGRKSLGGRAHCNFANVNFLRSGTSWFILGGSRIVLDRQGR